MSGYPPFPNQPTTGGPGHPQPAPYGDAPNPYATNPYGPYGPPPGMAPPKRSAGLWWLLGCGGLGFLLLCCGSCGGFVFWGVQLTEKEIADQLRDNPKLVEKLGTVESFRHDWSEFLGDDSDSDHDVFAVRGSKGSGKVIVEHTSDFGETEEIHSAVLVLPSGERIELIDPPELPIEAN